VSVNDFVIVSNPTITSFTPTLGPAGTEVTLTGSNFTGTIQVSFNGTLSSSFSLDSDTQLRATVPSGTSTGPITVQNAAGAGTSSSDFNVTSSPTISSFTPEEGLIGTEVTITGTAFSDVTGVSFNSTPAISFLIDSDTQIRVDVPIGATTGPIRVTNGSGTGTSATDFTVHAPPAITSFTPTNGVASTEVTISGGNFSNAVDVSFNGMSSTDFTIDSDSQIRATVPASATTGPVSVANNFGTGISSSHFTIVSLPALTSFSPTDGPVGTEVTLSGSNFVGITDVSFNGVSASSFTVDSETQVRADVPFGATSGALSVSNAAGTATSLDVFTVTSSGPSTLTLNPTDDAYVRSSRPDENYGEDIELKVRKTSVDRIGYVKFRVTGLSGAPESATLRLFVIDESDDGGSAFLVSNNFSGTTTPWNEHELAFGNAPEISGSPLSSVGAVGLNEVAEFDVTSAITGDGDYSFAIANLSRDLANYNSKESFNPPELVIETGGGVSTIPTVTSFSPTSGSVGTEVTVSGANFTGLTNVSFNGTAAISFTADSDSELRAQVPSGATTGPISVTNSAGTATSVDDFTVTSGPGIASFTPTSGSVGTQVTITGANFTSATGVGFNGVSASSFAVDSETQIRASVPSGASTGPISVTTGAGTATSFDDFVVVDPPTISSFTPTSGPVGTEVTVSGDNFSGLTDVSFNGLTSSSFTIDSDGEVRATVPSGASTGPVSVTNSAGTAISVGDFTVTEPPSSQSLVFNPTDDAYVRSSRPDANYGGDIEMKVRISSALRIAYLKFSVSGIVGDVESAVLRLGVIDESNDGGSAYSVSNNYEGTTTSWDEDGIVWDNAPAITGDPLSSVGAIALNDTVEFDVRAAVVGNGTFSFAIKNSSSDLANYSSKEGVVVPELVIEMASGTANPPTISSFDPASGPVGTEVIVTGSDLGGVTLVAVNGVTASSFSIDSDTQLRAIVPSGASTGKITVSNAVGTATSLSDFVVTNVPGITSFAPTSGTVGTEVTLSGANFTGTTSVAFHGTSATSFTVDSDTQLRATVPSGATTGPISATNSTGTGSSADDFVVVAPPTVTSFTPTEGSDGTEVTVSGTNFSAATNVAFNGTSATSFIVDADNKLRTEVPSGATTGPISVTNSAGTATSVDDFTVTAGSGTITFLATDDAYVRSSRDSSNYGDDIELKVRLSSATRMAYLKFNVSGLSGTVQSAVLRLGVLDGSDDGGSVYSVSNSYEGTATPWDEEGLIWANRPPLPASPLSSVGAVSFGQAAEFDVTTAIVGDGIYSFAVKNNSTDLANYSSKEGFSQPELVISTGLSKQKVAEEDVTNGHVAEADEAQIPEEIRLYPNYPNPFNAETNIEYALPQDSKVKLGIFNLRGQLVRVLVDDKQKAGIRRVRWDGKNEDEREVGTGIYFVRLEIGDHRFSRKITLQK
nr:DNRLRE domain-containing protein [candidate division KSB1 bacterium]NIR69995.1 DNRLRE domain-containing protein [candidate division KSB1 bacterium]NIS23018.1 DNRLRE domain-containing protein [candidate division KSB1 bacterium]NIT69876.1 DNRLRE domain-containing protein [candidate division KSB1 bacterium]NIU23525.1 DNRLRE domain-containing protein [candidate division KSB1 bacterium]